MQSSYNFRVVDYQVFWALTGLLGAVIGLFQIGGLYHKLLQKLSLSIRTPLAGNASIQVNKLFFDKRNNTLEIHGTEYTTLYNRKAFVSLPKSSLDTIAEHGSNSKHRAKATRKSRNKVLEATSWLIAPPLQKQFKYYLLQSALLSKMKLSFLFFKRGAESLRF